MDQLKPYQLCTLRETQTLPESSHVKFYAQFISFHQDDSLTWSVEDRGSGILLDLTSCGFEINPNRGEWFRILGCKVGERVRPSFSPLPALNFDPLLFERCLEIRRKFEKNFESEILNYAEPIEL